MIAGIGGAASFRRRLLELGLLPGTPVQLVRTAPFADPLEVEVRGFRLSLGRAQAKHVALAGAQAEVAAEPDPPRTTTSPSCAGSGATLGGASGAERSAARAMGQTVALAGNPNTGKTTLFNALTGASARVGNLPGVTVEDLRGRWRIAPELEVELADIPGAYSLSAHAPDEQVAIDSLLGSGGRPAPGAAIVVLNATVLSRSLYLLLQLQELDIPLIAAVNMMDEAQRDGIALDFVALERHFGVPFVGIAARYGEGLDRLTAGVRELLAGGATRSRGRWHWSPSDPLARSLDAIAESGGSAVRRAGRPRRRAYAAWCLLSLGGGDELVGIPSRLRAATERERAGLLGDGLDPDLELIGSRYRHIDRFFGSPGRAAVAGRRRVALDSPSAQANRTPGGRPAAARAVRPLQHRLDALLTHPLAGLVVFGLLMGTVFTAIFDWATPLMDGLDAGFDGLARTISAWSPASLWVDLLANGIVRGVGSVVVFVPQIAILFLFIAVLEGSGYLARAAFTIDRLMRRLGLNGRAFIPLMSGYACAIPAVMATRTMRSRRDRLLTMMVIPLVSCSARLPVYTLIIGTLLAADRPALGPFSSGALVMLGLYAVSMVMALLAAAVIGRTVLEGRQAPLLLELPPYRLPSPRSVLLHVGHKLRLFLRTAGTVIVALSVVLWALFNFPREVDYSRDYGAELAAAASRGDAETATRLRAQRRSERLQGSYAGRLGRLIEPVIEPLGFDWKIGIALVGSFAAREVFVATLGMVYGAGDVAEDDASLRRALQRERRADGRRVYSPLTGLSLLVFFLIAMQCMSTLAVVRQEAGSWRWPLFMLGYLTLFAYLASLATYQIGRALGYG